MGESLVFGAIASSALVIGSLAGSRIKLPERVLAALLAFAAGALITALAFELFEDSYEQGGIWRAAAGLAAGAVVFTALSFWLDRLAEGRHPEQHGSEKLDPDAASRESGAVHGVHARLGGPRPARRRHAGRRTGERGPGGHPR